MRFHGDRCEQVAVMSLSDGSWQSSTHCWFSYHAPIMTGASASASLTVIGCTENDIFKRVKGSEPGALLCKYSCIVPQTAGLFSGSGGFRESLSRAVLVLR